MFHATFLACTKTKKCACVIYSKKQRSVYIFSQVNTFSLFQTTDRSNMTVGMFLPALKWVE